MGSRLPRGMMAAVRARSGYRSRRASATCWVARSACEPGQPELGAALLGVGQGGLDAGQRGEGEARTEAVVGNGSSSGCAAQPVDAPATRVRSSASRAQRRCRSRLRSSWARRMSDWAPSLAS